jgi:hypothetical protein
MRLFATFTVDNWSLNSYLINRLRASRRPEKDSDFPAANVKVPRTLTLIFEI